MVSIGGIFFGGSTINGESDKPFFSAICFELTEKSRISLIQNVHEDKFDWEIEICEKSFNIVARCEQVLSVNEIINHGNDVCQNFLDHISIRYNHYYQIRFPFENFYMLYFENSQFILKNSSLIKLNFNVSFSLETFDEKGAKMSEPNVIQPKIPEFIRYYRKSCLSQDVLDAYRNLYLSFESMLYKINPLKNRQREADWLKESLHIINTKVPLINYTPPETFDPIEQIIVEQYLNIRIKLFHAKKDNILPESITISDVDNAYKKLLPLWRAIAIHFFNLQMQTGGITKSAFYDMMDYMFLPHFSLQMTCDNAPVKNTDSMISNDDKCILHFHDYLYTHESIPEDQIILSGSLEKSEFLKIAKIFRIGLVSDSGTLFAVQNYEGGLLLEGVDVFKKEFYIKFMSTSSTKMVF